MSYLQHIFKPTCVTCHRPATETLIGNMNQRYADYCTPHSKVALRELSAREDRDFAALTTRTR